MTSLRSIPRRTATLVPVAALAVALAACGGGVSKAQYVKKADASCGAGNATLAAVAKPSNLPELATAAATVATTVDAQAAGLRKVQAPGSDKAAVAAMIGALADVAGPARALQAAAGKTDDAATAGAANDLKAKVDSAATQARAYGLNACGTGLQAPVTTVFEGGRSVLKAAFVARAEALCTAASKKADALSSPTSLASTGKYLNSYIPIEEKLFADIKALAQPPGDEATVADMLAAQDQVIAKDKQLQAAAAKASTATFAQLSDEEDPLITAANSKFDAYGVKMCGTLSSF
ncbi:MAG TPA: hypothetical protein VHT97_02990 [Acidimicrobiales bacterium]|jgi:hypothetical protein|nr:hypothetical protein [Acidimicrobiales bacterium]